MSKVLRKCLAVAGAGAVMSLAFATGASASNLTKSPIVAQKATRPVVGVILVAVPGGATLYTDSNDTANHSTCTGSCAAVWPPYLLPAGDTTAKGVKGIGSFLLPGGSRQVTFDKKPLYTFVDDSGHSVNGNGVGPFSVVHLP